MLTLLYGTDYQKRTKRLQELVGEQVFEYMSTDTFDPGRITQLASGVGLFGDKEIIVMSGVYGDDTAKLLIKNLLSYLVLSPNLFILNEEKMLKKDLKPFEKAKVAIEQFDTPKTNKKEETFNMFLLSDAFGVHDKKKLWILYQQALKGDVAPEEIHSILWWQAKNMLLVAKENKNPGLHPFVFGKTQQFIKKYTLQDLENAGKKLVHIFNSAREGKGDLGRELEKYILTL